MAKWELDKKTENSQLYSEIILNCLFHENKDVRDYAIKASTHLFKTNTKIIAKAAFHAIRLFDNEVKIKDRDPEICKHAAPRILLNIALTTLADPVLSRELEDSISDEEFTAVKERLTAHKHSVRDPEVLNVMRLDLDAKPVPEDEYRREKLRTINTTVSYQTNLEKWDHYRNFKNTVTYCGNVDVDTDPRGDRYSFQFTGILRDYMNFRHQSKLNSGVLKTEQPNSIIAFDLYNHCWEIDNPQNYHVLICNDEAVVIDPHPSNMDNESDLERYLFVVRKNLQFRGIKQVRLCQYDSLETKSRSGRMKLYDVKDDGSLSLHLEIEGLPSDRPRLESVKRGNNYLGMALSNFLKDTYGEHITKTPEGCDESRGATNLIKSFVEYWNTLDVAESGKQYQRVVDTMNTLDIERYRLYDSLHKWYVP